MDELDETAVHHLIVQRLPRQQRNLISIKLGHRLGSQLTIDSILDSRHETGHEGIPALAGSLT